MLWLYPAAWALAAAIAAPFVVHLLTERRARPQPFPSLRFVAASRLASVRRRALEDWVLLAIRAAILAAAVAAVAGPLFVNGARRASWNARRAVAIVSDEGSAGDALQREASDAFASRTFTTRDLRDGIARAAAWLDTVPPARRELVVSASFARGSIDAGTFSRLPSDIGIRLVRGRALPSSRPLPDAIAWSAAAAVGAPVREQRRTTVLDGPITRTLDRGPERAAPQEDPLANPAAPQGLRVPLAILAAPRDRPAADAALAAVLLQAVPPVPSGRAATIVFAGARERASIARTAHDLHAAWMADAADRLMHDGKLQEPFASAPALEDGFVAPRWTSVALTADGAPAVAVATDDANLLIASAISPESAAAPSLLQSVFNAIGDVKIPSADEILPLPDLELRAFERPAGEARPRVDAIQTDDRRWFWGIALALIALEWLMRGSSRRSTTRSEAEERARVA